MESIWLIPDPKQQQQQQKALCLHLQKYTCIFSISVGQHASCSEFQVSWSKFSKAGFFFFFYQSIFTFNISIFKLVELGPSLLSLSHSVTTQIYFTKKWEPNSYRF